MKLLLKPGFILTFLIALIAGFSFTSCHDNKDNPPSQKLTSPLARKLVDSTCHFISKKDIESYVARYQRFKKAGDSALVKGTLKNMFSDSCSFNNNIVRQILAADSCIGLRVLYGLGPDNRLHVILVGIGPNYSTLYIKRPNEKCYPAKTMEMKKVAPPQAESTQAQTAQADIQSAGSEVGGGEMGQMP